MLVVPTGLLFMTSVTSEPAVGPAQVQSVEAGRDLVYEEVTVEEPAEALKQRSSVADQHSDPVEPILVEDDAEEEQKLSEPFGSSSSMDGVSIVDPSEQSLACPVDPCVEEQDTALLEPPMSLPVLDSLSNHIVVPDA